MGLDSSDGQILSRIATSDEHGENSLYFEGWKAYDSNPFHLTDNPSGVIQMGLAENQLSFDLIEEWIKKNPKASICTAEGAQDFREIANFQDYHGLKEFRNAVAKFVGRVRGGRVKFDPDRVVMAGGATGANETIMFCLADPEDAFLVPTPYYPAFDRDLRWRTRVKLLPVHCSSSNNFQITRDSLEEAYDRATSAKINVKGLIIANPSNPLGTVMDKNTLKSLVSFATDHSIHLVCDEIYSATIFKAPDFVSVAEIIQDMPCNLNLIHIIYSLSKDMGLPGFRVGIIYSYNDVVVSCSRKMSSFGLVSSQTQHLLAAMLSDDEFVGKFLEESARRLGNRHRTFTEGLKEVGIRCLEGNAGLYCWMNLRPLMKDYTVEAEMKLWRVIVEDVKLNISPGSSFHCSESGWFRVCFANMDDATVEVALRRIQEFVAARKGVAEQTPVQEKKQWSRNLRLSLPLPRDGGLVSPHVVSSFSDASLASRPS